MELRNQPVNNNSKLKASNMDDPMTTSGIFSCFNNNGCFNCTNILLCGESLSQCLTRTCGLLTCFTNCIPNLCDVFGIQGDVSANGGRVL